MHESQLARIVDVARVNSSQEVGGAARQCHGAHVEGEFLATQLPTLGSWEALRS